MEKTIWFVDDEEVTELKMKDMADAVESPMYDHSTVDGCRAELTCAGHIVRGSRHGWRLQFEPISHA